MSTCPSPITAETFPQAWRCIARKRYWAKKKWVIRSICVPVSQLLYFFAFVILAYGAAYSMTPDYIKSLIAKVPELILLWEKFAAILLAPAQTELQRILCCGVFLILFPFAASLPLALAVVLFYHPRKPKSTGNPAQDSWELWVMSKHAQAYAHRKEGMMANICGVFAGLLILLAVFGLVLYWMKTPSYHYQIRNNSFAVAWMLFLCGAGAFAAYKLLNLPLMLLLKLLHFCRVSQQLMDDAEAYYHSFKSVPQEN